MKESEEAYEPLGVKKKQGPHKLIGARIEGKKNRNLEEVRERQKI